MVREENYDVVIVGCGVGGLYTALNLPSEDRILMICKEDIESCDSMLAQGGICVLRDETDYDAYFEDTMRAGTLREPQGECGYHDPFQPGCDK